MENNELKESVRKNIKEEIAISNIRKEFDMKTNRSKKIVYVISSMCAVFILVIGIFLGINSKLLHNDIDNTQNLNVKLNINKVKNISSSDMDIKTTKMEETPDKFKFIENIRIPTGYQSADNYNVYIKKDKEVNEYNLLHDYEFNYKKDDLNNIKITFSEIEKPLRDCFIYGEDKISKIGDVELIISQWKQMYIASFKYKDIYFDIETTGITENELVDLLKSIIENI